MGPKCVEVVCSVKSTSEEILMDILMKLIPEQISRNNGNIPLEEYTLKMFGTDEFLVRSSPIGTN